MNTNQEKREFAIEIKGEITDEFLNEIRDAFDLEFKVGFGGIKFTGTQEELDRLISTLSNFEKFFKVIGILDLSETLIEISGTKNVKGDFEEIIVFEVHNPKKRFKINFEEANFLIKHEERTHFQSKFPDSFRTFVKKQSFKEIVEP